MKTEMTCRNCGSEFTIRDTDRGGQVPCPLCGKDVPVAVPVGTVLPTAKLLPTAPPATPPVARAIPATPVRVNPIPVSPRRAEATRPRRRSDPDGEEYDREADRAVNLHSTAIWVLIGLGVVVVFVGLAVGIWLISRTSEDTAGNGGGGSNDGFVEPKPHWDPNRDPGAAQPPSPLVPPVFAPVKEPEWRSVPNADGFEALVPGVMSPPSEFRPLGVNLALGGRDGVKGKKYGSLTVNVFQVVFCGFEIHYADFPDGPFDAEEMMRKMHIEIRPEWPVKTVTLAGHPAVEIAAGVTRQNIQGVVIRGTKVGPRFFTVKFTYLNPDLSPKWPEYRDKFFANFRITLDPNTPAPPPMPRGTPPPGRANPNALPGVEPAPSPGPVTPYAVAKVQPFWGAVFVPEKNEVLTVGPRLTGNFGRGGGVLRRYSLPEFRLKGSYPMPRAATRVVHDPVSSTLYCTTLSGTRPDTTIRDSERVVAFGDIEAYDLNPIWKGSAAEKDELKPAFVVPFSGAKLTGLDLSRDGQWLYTVRTTQMTKPRGWKASLVRVNVGQRKVLDPLDLPAPVLQAALSPDGGTIYLSEIQLSEFDGEAPGAGQGGKIDVVDVSGWRFRQNFILAGTILDTVITADNARLVCGIKEKVGGNLLSVSASSGEVVPLEPATDPNRAAGYVGTTKRGHRLVASVRQAEGVDVYEILDLGRKNGLKLLARGKEAAGTPARTPLGGHFYLSPDGRFAIFQVGVVIDVENPAKKPPG